MTGHRLWFDTEFIEDGRTIDLISIGAVRDDGVSFYAESSEVDLSRASDWVRENVIPHLRGGAARSTRAEIATALVEFAGPQPEWWAYFADYDWVVLCQLYGRMIDLPEGWPMYCRDVKQLADHLDVDGDVLHALAEAQDDASEHHALADAHWAHRAWESLRGWLS